MRVDTDLESIKLLLDAPDSGVELGERIDALLILWTSASQSTVN